MAYKNFIKNKIWSKSIKGINTYDNGFGIWLCFLGGLFTLTACTTMLGKEYARPRIECEKDISNSSKPQCKAKVEIGTQIDLSGQ